ncbi:MAG: hypothetical protein WBN09_01590 [Woeseiaceae bacterium]
MTDEHDKLSDAELQQLDAATQTEPPPHMVARWHDAIDRAAEQEVVAARSKLQTFSPSSFFWGAAITAAVAFGIAIGVFIGNDEPAMTPTYATVEPPPQPELRSAFSRGLLVHFAQSKQDLTRLDETVNGERAALVMNIVQQNRLFARMARQNDSEDLARVLRAFEPILLRLSAEDITPEEAERLRSQLAFELDIVLTKLSQRVSDKTDAITT